MAVVAVMAVLSHNYFQKSVGRSALQELIIFGGRGGGCPHDPIQPGPIAFAEAPTGLRRYPSRPLPQRYPASDHKHQLFDITMISIKHHVIAKHVTGLEHCENLLDGVMLGYARERGNTQRLRRRETPSCIY
jgi:hypothetical protein